MDSAMNFLIELFGRTISTLDSLVVIGDITVLGLIIAVIVILTVIGLVFSASRGGSK